MFRCCLLGILVIRFELLSGIGIFFDLVFILIVSKQSFLPGLAQKSETLLEEPSFALSLPFFRQPDQQRLQNTCRNFFLVVLTFLIQNPNVILDKFKTT